MKNYKRIVSIILVFSLCILNTFTFNIGLKANAYTSHNVDEAVTYLHTLVGKKVGNGQCVDLIVDYYQYLGVPRAYGNGEDYATNTLPSGWSRIKGAQPQKGDIMIWTGTTYGHVAICGGDGVYFHQNWDGLYVSIKNKSYTSGYNITATGEHADYWGVIRPDFQNSTHTCSYGSWSTITAATCTTAGSKKRSCTVCGDSQTQSIAATGHNYKNSIADGGYLKTACSSCDYIEYSSEPCISYTVEDEQLTITECDSYYYGYGDIEIPSEIDGYPVTSIEEEAFAYCDFITSITLPNSVTYIGDYAFYECENLASITIPDSVIHIGSGAFEGCTSLASVTIPTGLTSIEDCAFYNCSSIKNIKIPESVTSIGDYAFSECDNLASITIPNSVRYIGSGAFSQCTSLTSITLPAGLTSIEYDTFYNCTSLTNITILENVSSIGDYAFYGCSSLKNINIPESVTSIGECAFAYCNSLTDIEIPYSVEDIGDCVFRGCISLENISVSKDNDNYASADGILFDKDKMKLICYPAGKKEESYIIPDDVFEIEEYAFSYCEAIKSVTIPDSVEYIYIRAFSNCTNLTNIIIPDSVEYIAELVFEYCASLENINVSENNYKYTSADGILFNKEQDTLICFPNGKKETSYTIPNSVTTIGSYAFTGSNNLKNITIPESVTNINDFAFYDCDNLANINISDNVTNIGQNAFNVTDYYHNSENWENGVLYIGNYLIEAKWDLEGDYVIKTGTKTIADCAFSNRNYITGITIPDSVTSIGDYAFDQSGLINITISDSVTDIGLQAFDNTPYSRNNENWGNGVLYVGNHLVDSDEEDCEGEYVIKAGTKTIADYAFFYCDSLTGITIPDSVTSIGYFAFYGCESLANINISDNVTNIGEYAFNGTEYYYNDENWENGVLYIGNYLIRAMSYCKDDYVIKTGTKTIADNAFFGCGCLTSIEIPRSVTKIGSNAFEKCTSLKEVRYYGSEENKDNITINYGNKYLLNAEWEYIIHSFGDWIIDTEPTCLETGLKFRKCTICGEKETEEMPIGEHSFSNWEIDTEPTCLTSGLKIRKCKICRLKEEQELPFSGHNYCKTDDWTVPSCKEDGYIILKCSFCGDENRTETAAKHIYHNGKCATCDISSEVVESAHNYAKNTDYTWEITKADAYAIEIVFSSETETEEDYDFIYIYNEDDRLMGKYSGTELAGKTISFFGDTVKIRLTSDNSSQEYGFYATVTPISLSGDLNGDNSVDAVDLIYMRKALLTNKYTYAFDITGDNLITLADLVRLKKKLADITT